MTRQEADKIFKEWQNYVEIADKLWQIFGVVPESFLPYPKDQLEEALNITAKYYFDLGDKKIARYIQETMILWVGSAEEDHIALEQIRERLDLMFANPDLKETYLKNLKDSQTSWLQSKEKE